MLPQIESLLVIQDRDHKIAQLQSELDKIPRDAASIKKRLDDATAKLETSKSALQQNELQIKKIDLERKTRKETIERLNVQRFETKKNDEYAALGAEVVRYQDMVDTLETQELEFMEKVDQLNANFKQAKSRLNEFKQSMAQEVKALTERKTVNAKRIAELNEERAILIKDIDSSLLNMYDRVFLKKGNAAVSPMHESQCGGCHMKLIAETVSKTIAEKEISQCENCGCFLYSV